MDESLIQLYPEIERNHFWWVSRREFVRGLIGAAGVGEQSSILDIGCGSGVMARELSEDGATVTGVDIVSHADWAATDGGGVEFKEGDYLDLVSDLGTFDCVLALDVMEHIEDERAFVDSVKRNIRPGGCVVLTVPAYQWLWSNHDVMNHHFRRYTRSRLADSLGAGGLNVTRCGYIFFALIVPALVTRRLQRIRRDGGVTVPAGVFNRGAEGYFRWEHRVAVRRRDFLPAGTSVVAVCKAA